MKSWWLLCLKLFCMVVEQPIRVNLSSVQLKKMTLGWFRRK